MNNMKRLAIVGTLVTGTLGMVTSPAFSDTDTSHAPDNAGITTYNTNNNHYEIYDTKEDSRAVAVIFYHKNGPLVGFQSCHEGMGIDVRAIFPGRSWVNSTYRQE